MLSEITRKGVDSALAEFDRLGREAFLAKYGFRPARSYYVTMDGRRYDSKAIAGAAHGYDFPDEGPLSAGEFSGGNATVARVFERLGYEVAKPGPSRSGWATEERVLALDLYLRLRVADKSHPEVVALSEELNRRRFHPDAGTRDNFRNPAGVALKLANFAAIDPSHAGRGMSSFAAGDAETWDEYASDRDTLAEAVRAIRSGQPLPPPTIAPSPGRSRRVPLEQRHVDSYELTPPADPLTASRREAELVEHFGLWLVERGSVVTSHHYDVVQPPLRSDLADDTNRRIWEAKAEASRSSVRMALGQLIDYLRFEDSGWTGGVLLSNEPSADLVALIRSAGRSVAWRVSPADYRLVE